MSSTIFRKLFVDIPGVLRAWMGEQATIFRTTVALSFDLLTDHLKAVQNARSPLLCDSTVLPYHGRDRRIRRYANEAESSYRERLAKWRQIWASSGRAWGILRQLRILLKPIGRPRIRYVSTTGDGAESQWFTLEPGNGVRDYFEIDGLDPEFSRHLEAPGNWLWDAGATNGKWSRFWILIYTSGLTTTTPTSLYDDVAEWDGGTDYWDGYLTSDQIQDIVDLCNDWKAAHSQLEGVFLVHDDSIFDPTGSGAGFPDGTWDNLIDPFTGAFNRATNVTYSYERP